MTAAAKTPEHVSANVVYDFDLYADQRYGNNLHESLSLLQSETPAVFYTPRNGGHWVITRQNEIQQVVLDPEHFSVREMQIPRVPNPPLFIPLSLDPPDNIAYRQALMPSFSPRAVNALEEKIRHWAAKIVGEVADKGECDFVHDVTELFPVSIFMELMGMDLNRLREFRALAEYFFGVQNNAEELGKATGQIIAIMTEYIEQKRQHPDDSLISHLVKAEVNGRPLRLDELQNMCLLLFVGGLHTVTNLSGFAYWHLAADPELQKRLAENPELIPNFVEESLRMFGVINTPRIVRKDCEKFGVQFREGDMVLCMLPLAGRDEKLNANATTFDIDRKNREHMTFSKGAHLCIGHFLARAEIRILTEEWLKRVPRFSIKPGGVQKYTTGTTMGITNLPLVWKV